MKTAVHENLGREYFERYKITLSNCEMFEIVVFIGVKNFERTPCLLAKNWVESLLFSFSFVTLARINSSVDPKKFV